MSTLLADTAELQKVQTHNQPSKTTQMPPRRRKIGFFDVLSDIFLTAAVLIGLYIIYMMYWTGVVASWDQNDLLKQYKWDMPSSVSTPAPKYHTDVPCENEPKAERDMIGRVYIPRFGGDYVRNLVQGTSKYRVLDLQGFGHYQSTAMPGCIGNMAAAAHRGGFGESLKYIDGLVNDDALIIRSLHYWYVYKMYKHEIVKPKHGEVILPIPSKFKSYVSKNAEEDAKQAEQNGQEYAPKDPLAARERLLTFTTCHPRYGVKERYIVHAKLDYWSRVSEGVPEEMLNAGTKIYN
jgi:sortase A